MNDESRPSLGISGIILLVFLALILNQGYGLYAGLRLHSDLAKAKEEGRALQDKLKPMLADVDKNKAALEGDQKMAVDLTALLVRVAQNNNQTAAQLIPAVQRDLQELGLSIQLQPDQVNKPAAK